ncbi:MAG: DUF3027 domain-containing protein, partial [Microbacterium sp.]
MSDATDDRTVQEQDAELSGASAEPPVVETPEELPDPDARLLEAHDLALAALHEVTSPDSIGRPAAHRVEADGVVSLRFETTLLGYPGWYWTVSLAVVEEAEPTVLEVELLPGDDALLAPDWVPWSVRLKEYQAQQAAAAEAARAAEAEKRADAEGDDPDEPEDDSDDSGDQDESYDDEYDSDDFSEDGSPILHSGDVDGVDIDELDADGDDDDQGDDETDDDGQDDDQGDDDA